MTYQETLDRLESLRVQLDTNSSRPAGLASEFMKLKRTLSRFPEHKTKKASTNANSI